jgi:hypothetical protein
MTKSQNAHRFVSEQKEKKIKNGALGAIVVTKGFFSIGSGQYKGKVRPFRLDSMYLLLNGGTLNKMHTALKNNATVLISFNLCPEFYGLITYIHTDIQTYRHR